MAAMPIKTVSMIAIRTMACPACVFPLSRTGEKVRVRGEGTSNTG
jgi:hypothetical protein